MTSHELAKHLMQYPELPIVVEGWTSDKIGVALFNDDDGKLSKVILVNDETTPTDIPWSEMHWTNHYIGP